MDIQFELAIARHKKAGHLGWLRYYEILMDALQYLERMESIRSENG